MSEYSDQANYGRGGYLPDMGSGGPSAFSRPYGGYSYEQGLPYQSGAATLPMMAAPPYAVSRDTRPAAYSTPNSNFYGPIWTPGPGSWGAPGTEAMGPPALARGMDATRISNLQKILNTMHPQQAVQSPGYSDYNWEGFGGEGAPHNQPGTPQASQEAPMQAVQQEPKPMNMAEYYKNFQDNTPATETGNPNHNSYYRDAFGNAPDRGGGFLSGPELQDISERNRQYREQRLRKNIQAPLDAARDAGSGLVSGLGQAQHGIGNFFQQLLDFQKGHYPAPDIGNPYFLQQAAEMDNASPYLEYGTLGSMYSHKPFGKTL